jgi:hypothetical protein
LGLFLTLNIIGFFIKRDSPIQVLGSIYVTQSASLKGGIYLMIFFYILFAIFILFNINKLTNSLCQQKEIPEERQSNVFRTINILITILLISSYIEILVAIT